MADAKLAEAYVEITTRNDKLREGLSKGESAVRSWADRMKSLARSGFDLGLDGVGELAGGLLEAGRLAADLGETQAKVREVFKESAGVVTGFADEMAEKYGFVKRETLDAASALGLLVQGAGMGSAAAASMSVQLSRVAAEAVSMFNVADPSEAFEKIRAALSGEYEPLRAFGVMLDEAKVKAEALSLGLVEGAAALDDKAKITARASLITKGLAVAEGDLDRNIDTVTSKQRKLTGDIENFKTELGEHVIPVMADAIKLFNELFAGQGAGAKSGAAAMMEWAQASVNAIRAVWSDWTILNPFMSAEAKQAKLATVMGTDKPTARATPAARGPIDLAGGFDIVKVAEAQREQGRLAFEAWLEEEALTGNWGAFNGAERRDFRGVGRGAVNAPMEESRFSSRSFSDGRAAWQSIQSDVLQSNIPKQHLDESRKLNDSIREVEQDLKRLIQVTESKTSAATMTGPA